MLPSALKKVKYSSLADIDFTSAKTMAKKLNTCLDNSDEVSVTASQNTPQTRAVIPSPMQHEAEAFFQKLDATGVKSAILTITSPYSDKFVPLSMQSAFPEPLTNLYDESHADLEYNKLLEVCSNISILISQEQADAVEAHTCGQSASRLWYRYRAGRITASRMKAICHTDMMSPSKSLILAICNPSAVRFSSKATEWGCKHENVARESYIDLMKGKHQDFFVEEAGLFIHPQFPHLGATPDGILSCACCGVGVLEIKCPYCVRNEPLSDERKNFCLQMTEDGELRLSKNHMYYYQVQTQIHVCSKDFADFVVWTQKDVHIERVMADEEFWSRVSKKASDMFNHVVMPELVAKYFTRKSIKAVEQTQKPSNSTDETVVALQDQGTTTKVWCLCQEEEYGKMICCDNSDCQIAWFHYPCVNIKRKPKGKWFCLQCK